MIVDSSALIALLLGEPDSLTFLNALSNPNRKLISAFTFLETSIVIEARKGPEGTKALAELMACTNIEQVAFDASQAEVALDAWRRYGKGRDPAGLNIGNCVSYALARTTNQRLLYKGNDFSQTDLATGEFDVASKN
jgi:ribonuclease VapC